MATGDQNDFEARIAAQGILPVRWFGVTLPPVVQVIISGIAAMLANIYSLYAYAKNQTRISTATDGFLDLISYDFFGGDLPRKPQETDAVFRSRIKANLLLSAVTRPAMIATLQLLTGRTPKIFEPTRPLDTGAYNKNIWGYNVAGGYGSLQLHNQVFITAYRPAGQGIPNIAGYGNPEGAYNRGSQAQYVNPSMITGIVTDADIYATIARTLAAGCIAWTQLSN